MDAPAVVLGVKATRQLLDGHKCPFKWLHVTADHVAEKGCISLSKSRITCHASEGAKGFSNRLLTVGRELMTVCFRIGQHDRAGEGHDLGGIVPSSDGMKIIYMPNICR